MKVARGKPPSASARRSDFVSQAAAAFAVFLWCGCRVFRSSEQYAHKVRAPKFSNDLQCFMVTSQHSDPPLLPGSDWSGPRWYQASCRRTQKLTLDQGKNFFFGLRPPQSTGCRLSQPVEFGCKISGGQTVIDLYFVSFLRTKLFQILSQRQRQVYYYTMAIYTGWQSSNILKPCIFLFRDMDGGGTALKNHKYSRQSCQTGRSDRVSKTPNFWFAGSRIPIP